MTPEPTIPSVPAIVNVSTEPPPATTAQPPTTLPPANTTQPLITATEATETTSFEPTNIPGSTTIPTGLPQGTTVGPVSPSTPGKDSKAVC